MGVFVIAIALTSVRWSSSQVAPHSSPEALSPTAYAPPDRSVTVNCLVVDGHGECKVWPCENSAYRRPLAIRLTAPPPAFEEISNFPRPGLGSLIRSPIALALDQRGPDRPTRQGPPIPGSNSGHVLVTTRRLGTLHTLRDGSQQQLVE